VVAEEDNGQGLRWIEIAPKEAETTIILHNKEFVEKMSPGLNLDTPSLMFTLLLWRKSKAYFVILSLITTAR
jgi:hypothetical protein